jgi:uncharacterized protein with PIN domain/sulfur carrier protein ThiS
VTEPEVCGTAIIRFYEELNFFLPPGKRKQDLAVEFRMGDTVKALIEALGVPHTEVDLVLVNGESATFHRRLRPGDRISVYPVFESFDISPVSKVRPAPLRQTRFVLDTHLGRLAQALRLLGFDALYDKNYGDAELAHVSAAERRILLTRDRGLLKRRIISHAYYVRSRQPEEQLGEVIRRFDLRDCLKPFSRCLKCNLLLAGMSGEEADGQVPAPVLARNTRFKRCPACGRIYWRGSHWADMQRRLERLLRREGDRDESRNGVSP